jgi:hypothetical protein
MPPSPRTRTASVPRRSGSRSAASLAEASREVELEVDVAGMRAAVVRHEELMGLVVDGAAGTSPQEAGGAVLRHRRVLHIALPNPASPRPHVSMWSTSTLTPSRSSNPDIAYSNNHNIVTRLIDKLCT